MTSLVCSPHDDLSPNQSGTCCRGACQANRCPAVVQRAVANYWCTTASATTLFVILLLMWCSDAVMDGLRASTPRGLVDRSPCRWRSQAANLARLVSMCRACQSRLGCLFCLLESRHFTKACLWRRPVCGVCRDCLQTKC